MQIAGGGFMLSKIILAIALVGNGNSLELYSANKLCDYGWREGAIKNSANLVIVDVCWRLDSSKGYILVQNSVEMPLEEFNLTPDGVVWIRKFLR